uniref:Uncharacterized protein n=1 Tax=Oxyrrhis marina TaxID=2969 RepID=A0A7S4LMZ5_OXYMA
MAANLEEVVVETSDTSSCDDQSLSWGDLPDFDAIVSDDSEAADSSGQHDEPEAVESGGEHLNSGDEDPELVQALTAEWKSQQCRFSGWKLDRIVRLLETAEIDGCPKKIDLDFTDGARPALIPFFRQTSSFQQLFQLHVSAIGCGITDESLSNIGSGIGRCLNLRSLQLLLGRNEIAHPAGLIEGIASCHRLGSMVLNFFSNLIGDDGLAIIGKAARGFSDLKVLRLNVAANKIEGKGLGQFGEGFNECRKLRALILDFYGGRSSQVQARIHGQSELRRKWG